MSDGGKGSARRPGNGYADGYERIFGMKAIPKPKYAVGAPDAFGPTKDGCCGVTVMQQCEGCPYDAEQGEKDE